MEKFWVSFVYLNNGVTVQASSDHDKQECLRKMRETISKFYPNWVSWHLEHISADMMK